jgi:hypothetical protein
VVVRASLLIGLIFFAFTACGTYNIRGKLEQSVNQYNDLVRGHKLDAAGLFAAGTLSKEFSERAEKAKNVRIVDYRIAVLKYDEDRGEAEVKVEVDYYTQAAYKLKTATDIQRWAYLEEDGKKHWRLISPPPEFP